MTTVRMHCVGRAPNGLGGGAVQLIPEGESASGQFMFHLDAAEEFEAYQVGALYDVTIGPAGTASDASPDALDDENESSGDDSEDEEP